MLSTVRTAPLQTSFARSAQVELCGYESIQLDLGSDEDDFDIESYVPDLEFIEDLGRGTKEVYDEYNLGARPRISSRAEGEEVGDDRLDICHDPLKLASMLIVQERIMHMATSVSDTFISKSLWNFCEVTSGIPTAVEQSFHFCRKRGEFENLGFVDVPPLRIIIDVSKGESSFSSTMPGKATMLGNRMRTPRTELLRSWYLASYLQDGCLRTSRSTEPKYLPQIMGGSGVRAPFGHPENLYLSVHAYRNGEYQRIYGTACQELRQCVSLLEEGTASMPVLCQRLRDKQEYLHGTYANKVFIPTYTQMDVTKESLPKPLIEATGGANRFVAYENRLVRTRNLVTRTEAVRLHAWGTRVRQQLLSCADIPTTDALIQQESRRQRKRFDMALNANAAFANLLRRNATIKDVQALTNEAFLIVNTGVTSFSRWDSEWLFHGGRDETFSIEDLTISEALYLRDEVSEEETFKVGGIPLNPVYGHPRRPIQTTTKVGLYQINSGMEEWAENLTARLLSHRVDGEPIRRSDAHAEFLADPEWVNDDSGIIARGLRDSLSFHARSFRVILASDDKRLANQLSNTCNIYVHRVSARDYIQYAVSNGFSFQDINPGVERFTDAFINAYGREDPIRQVYVDTGSIASAAAKLQFEGSSSGSNKLFERKLVETGLNASGKRFEKYTLVELESRTYLPCQFIGPTQKAKRYRFKPSTVGDHYRSPEASERSWRSGDSIKRRNY